MESDDSSCCRDMPMEVLNEILIYLPVKSLIRFTCVCKAWLHLIRNNPRFAIRHYLARTTSSSRLMDNVDYFVEYFSKYGRGCRSTTDEEVLRLSIYSLTEKRTFRLFKKLEFGPGLEVSVSNFCHGIMCVYVSSARGAKFLLCNPATREVVPLPVSPNIAAHGLPRFGLGFNPTDNDYKIVAAHPPAIFSAHNSWLVDVYSVRSGCWHSIHAIGSLEHFESLEGEPALNANGRILNWVGYLKSTTAMKGLVSFDMVDEVFRETPMPECVYPNSWRQHHLLPSSRCQACLCCSSFPSIDLRGDEFFNGIDIWVLNGDDNEQGMWIKQVSFRFPDQEVVAWPLNVWMNDKELFMYVQKNGTVEEVFHYDLGTQELKRTGRLGTLVNPDGYAESLVSIKGFMPSSSHEAAQGGNGKKDEKQEQKDDDRSACFIREVGRRRNDVRWSFSFKLF